MGRFYLLLPVILVLFQLNLQAQEPVSGFGAQKDGEYVEYFRGNLPLIISVPHGGYDKPANIPERTGRVSMNQDIYTIEIAYEMIRKIHELTGRYPYVIINHLHRTRLDANRALEEAASGDPEAEKVWHAYHRQVGEARSMVADEFGKGLFIDLHGHRHKMQRIELGYLLSGDELRLDDELLDEGWFDEFTSIRHLIGYNNLGLSLSDLIRGNFSLGSLLHDKGQVCVPDKRNLYPETGEPFFSGGFNLNRYGSSGGGEIDGIQIEVDLHTRTHEKLRKEVADDISMSLLEFLSVHYFPEMNEMAVYGQSVLDRYCGE